MRTTLKLERLEIISNPNQNDLYPEKLIGVVVQDRKTMRLGIVETAGATRARVKWD